MNNLPKVLPDSARPRVEPATFGLKVQRPKHYATRPTNALKCNIGA